MKIIYSIIFLFVFSCMEIPTDPPFDPDNSGLYFYPETLELSSGTNTQIEMHIDESGLSIFGITYAVEYNPDLLNFSNETGFTPGNLFGDEYIHFARADSAITQTDSAIIYITLSLTQGQNPVPAHGLLGQIEFHAINQGQTYIKFIQEYIFIYDSSGNEIPVENILMTPTQVQIN